MQRYNPHYGQCYGLSTTVRAERHGVGSVSADDRWQAADGKPRSSLQVAPCRSAPQHRSPLAASRRPRFTCHAFLRRLCGKNTHTVYEANQHLTPDDAARLLACSSALPLLAGFGSLQTADYSRKKSPAPPRCGWVGPTEIFEDWVHFSLCYCCR